MSDDLFDALTPQEESDWPIHGCAGEVCQVCANERKRRALAALGATDPRRLARHTDPWTSKKAAKRTQFRTGSHKGRLMEAYLNAPGGLTDEEAAREADLLHTGYWKRCADLRNDGLIEPVMRADGSVLTRKSIAGEQVMVCRAVR